MLSGKRKSELSQRNCALGVPRPNLGTGLDHAPRLGLYPTPERTKRLRPAMPDCGTVIEGIRLSGTRPEPAARFAMGGADVGRERCRWKRHGAKAPGGEAPWAERCRTQEDKHRRAFEIDQVLSAFARCLSGLIREAPCDKVARRAGRWCVGKRPDRPGQGQPEEEIPN